jgi:hypothetical protein
LRREPYCKHFHISSHAFFLCISAFQVSPIQTCAESSSEAERRPKFSSPAFFLQARGEEDNKIKVKTSPIGWASWMRQPKPAGEQKDKRDEKRVLPRDGGKGCPRSLSQHLKEHVVDDDKAAQRERDKLIAKRRPTRFRQPPGHPCGKPL